MTEKKSDSFIGYLKFKSIVSFGGRKNARLKKKKKQQSQLINRLDIKF